MGTPSFRCGVVLILCAVVVAAVPVPGLAACGDRVTLKACDPLLAEVGDTSTIWAKAVKADGNDVGPGQCIYFTITSGEGLLSSSTAWTNDDGVATVDFTSTVAAWNGTTIRGQISLGTPGYCTVKVLCGTVKVNGQTPTGAANVIVGKRTTLSGEANAGTPSTTTHSWAVGGSPIGGYHESLTQAYAVQLQSMQVASLYCYWVASTDLSASDQITVLHKLYSAETGQEVGEESHSVTPSASISVKRPSGSLGATHVGDVTCPGPDGYGYLSFGVDRPGTEDESHGVDLEANFTNPPGFTGGTGSFVQVVTSTLRRYQESDGTWWRLSASGVLDTMVEYPDYGAGAAYGKTKDSPGIGPVSDLRELTASDSYVMYWMYRPAGTTGDTIRVPLRKLSWSWSGHGVNDPPWRLASGTRTVPASVDCQALPVWNGNVIYAEWEQGQ